MTTATAPQIEYINQLREDQAWMAERLTAKTAAEVVTNIRNSTRADAAPHNLNESFVLDWYIYHHPEAEPASGGGRISKADRDSEAYKAAVAERKARRAEVLDLAYAEAAQVLETPIAEYRWAFETDPATMTRAEASKAIDILKLHGASIRLDPPFSR